MPPGLVLDGELVAWKGFRHLGQLELLAALKGAKAKPGGDAALVIAMTLALAAGAAIEVDAIGPMIW